MAIRKIDIALAIELAPLNVDGVARRYLATTHLESVKAIGEWACQRFGIEAFSEAIQSPEAATVEVGRSAHQ